MATQSTGRLAGKTAVLTGGTAGIGLETSLMVARQGARMAIIEIQKDAGRETARLIQSILLET
ncbi:SDR family NAD(P)-dependent oxidoreductase [Yoonia sp.]|uniref:SDR family NAD(P)-dependent oxidoreductase n=1 Tax=Yoonia sp. TaxID=2212373 RepID=UPI003976D9A1